MVWAERDDPEVKVALIAGVRGVSIPQTPVRGGSRADGGLNLTELRATPLVELTLAPGASERKLPPVGMPAVGMPAAGMSE